MPELSSIIAPPEEVSLWRFGAAFVVAVIADGIDWLGIGMIPGLFDIADFFFIAGTYKLIGYWALIDVAEFIPGEDVLPTYIGVVVLAFGVWMLRGRP